MMQFTLYRRAAVMARALFRKQTFLMILGKQTACAAVQD
jgi:hypothetical protein